MLFGPQTGNFFINNEDAGKNKNVKIFYSYLEILENDQNNILEAKFVFVFPDNFAKMSSLECSTK